MKLSEIRGDKITDPLYGREFVINGMTIKFTPTMLLIYNNGDIVYKKEGEYSLPTRLDFNTAKGIVGRLLKVKE